MKRKGYFKKALAGVSAAAVSITTVVPAVPAASFESEMIVEEQAMEELTEGQEQPEEEFQELGGQDQQTAETQAPEQQDTEITGEEIIQNDYVLYTVNCGTPDPSVVPNEDSERMGVMQSNVDQEYGQDEQTGSTWGRNPATEYSQAVNSGDDATDMGNSFIYMSDSVQFDQYKSSLGYSFEVPQGPMEGLEENTYEVTVAFKHYWDNRTQNIMLEGNTVATDIAVNYGDWVSRTFTVEVTDGELNVDVKAPRRTSAKQDPILNYIKVRAVQDQEEEAPVYSSFTGVAGESMYDTQGKLIQAHGGQIQQLTVDGETKWYWIGEDKTNDYRPVGGIHVYSSTDLYNWDDEGIVLRTMENPDQFHTDPYFQELYGDLSEEEQEKIFVDLDKNNTVMERPKMLYNEKTGKYVIWFHADGRYPGSDADYGKAKAGVAIADSPTGPFKLLGSYKLHHAGDNYGYDGEEGIGSVRDMNLFKDDDGTAYVIYSSEGNETMYISRLNDEYTNLAKPQGEAVEGVDFTRNFARWSREAPAMFKYKENYYIITSGCTGWNPNQAKYAVADNPMGPYTEIGDPCTDWGSGTTYDTQSTCVFPVDAENGKYIYMGDRWNADDLSESRYVWLPVEFQPDQKIALRRYENWTLEELDGKGRFEVVTELPSSVSSVTEIMEQLPQEITISYGTENETTPVAWTMDEYHENKIGTVTVTGNLTEKGTSFQHEIFVINPDTKYFFDSGAKESEYFNALKENLSDQILNTAADPKYSQDNKAGYTSVTEEESPDNFDMGLHDGKNELENGWWAAEDKNIEYTFELQPGAYTLSAGFQEWWDANRQMKITIAMGEEVLGEQEFDLSGKDKDLQIDQSFEVKETAMVTVSVSKRGSSDAVLSWLAVTGKESQEPADEINKTSLDLAVKMAEKLEAQQQEHNCYTKESWEAVQTALAAGRTLMEDQKATQEQVDAAFLELITACNLPENSVQKTGLKAAIEGAEAILAEEEALSQYTPESVEAVRKALEEAKRVFEEESADQESVNQAARALMDAVTSLLVEQEDSRLSILIRKAEEILAEKEQYTAASIGNLEAALEAAKETEGNPEATEEERIQAYNDLAKAMTELVRKAEKSELKTALDKAEEILAAKDQYVEDTVSNLQAVTQEAKTVYEKEDASPEEIGEAVKKLVGEILKARLLGDVDGNGAIDSADSAQVLKYAAEYGQLDELEQKAADVNRDKNADSGDAAEILQYASEKLRTF